MRIYAYLCVITDKFTSNIHLKIIFKRTDKIMKKYQPVDFPRVHASPHYRIGLISVCVGVSTKIFQIESKIRDVDLPPIIIL